MTQLLMSPDNALHSGVVHSHVNAYILPELRPFLHGSQPEESTTMVEDDGEEVVQTILDKSNNQLRMYGSAKEIAENIKIFRNFPESFRFFDDHKYPFNTTPVIYSSLNEEKYICKSDIYTIIQNIALHTIKRDKNDSFRVFLALVLKSKITQTDGHVEFVKFDEKMFDEIQKEMREGETKSLQQASAQRLYLEMLLLTENYAMIASIFRKLNPTIFDDDIANALLIELQHFPRSQIKAQKECIITWLTDTCVINGIEQIMTKRTPLFMSTPESSPITVRLFEDGDERYVMKEELYHALNRLSPESERFEIRNDGFVHKGMSFEEVKVKFGDRIQKIEFIRTPILRTKHRAVPIRAHFPEQFVIPAVDYFLEFWRNVIFGQKIFQKYQCSDWEKFTPLFHNIEELFDIEKKQQYFLRTGYHIEIVVGNSLLEYEVSPVKVVRNAKKNGFTAENLKNELNHLGLTLLFPEIQDYAEDVYEGIDKMKKERYLRTCDLFDALENCQLICVLNRIPILRKFLHNQKGCGRVLGYRCEQCKKEKTMSDALEVSHQPAEVQKTSELQNSTKNLNIENSKSSTPKQYSQPTLSAPKDCDKYMESSKTLEETENELKISQNQSKETQQKISNTEKELSEMKEENENIVESEAKKTEELNEEKEQIQENAEKLQKTILKQADVYKPIPERFKTISKPETEKFDIEATNSHENSFADVNKESKESEAEIEILRQKLVEKEEEIVNFKRDALIHEKTVKGFEELKAKIADMEDREKEMIETRRRNELAHSKTVLENERLMQENASFRSNLKDSNERIKSEIDTRDKELEKLARKIANYEEKQKKDESIRAEIQKENEELKKEIEANEEEKQKHAKTLEELSNLKIRIAGLEASEAQMSEARSQDTTTIEQLQKEILELKGSNELYCNNFNSINETVYRERQTFGAAQQQLVERISELERELMSRNQPENSDWIAEKRVMQEEIAEKTRQIAQVIESNVVLRTENEMNSRMVQNLLDRLSGMSISSGVAPTPPPSGPSTSSAPSTSSWNHQNPTRDSELEDVECVICLIDIKQRQKTIKCHQCRRRFHSKCASDWLKVKSECPACRGRLLDPHEFPAL